MDRPTKKATNSLTQWRFIIIGALVPIALTGFMAVPSAKHPGSKNAVTHDSVVDVEALMKRVMQLNKEKSHQKAIEVLLEVVEKHKEDAVLKALLVQTFDLFLEEEIRQGQQAIKQHPNDLSNYHRVAGALELVGDSFHAMEILLNAIQYRPKAVELWMKIAKLELKANRDMEALAVFKEVIRLDHKNSVAYNNAAYILAKNDPCNADDLKEAETFAKSARKLDPKNPEYLDTLAEVNFKKGDLKKAKTLIEEAIKLAPENDFYKNRLEKFTNNVPLTAE